MLFFGVAPLEQPQKFNQNQTKMPQDSKVSDSTFKIIESFLLDSAPGQIADVYQGVCVY